MKRTSSSIDVEYLMSLEVVEVVADLADLVAWALLSQVRSVVHDLRA